MTKRERIIRSLNHQESDIIPYHTDFTWQEAKRMQEYTGDKDFEQKYGFHIIQAGYGKFEDVPGKPEHVIDEHGVEWNRSGADKDIGVVDHYLIEDLEENTYRFPPVLEKEFRAEIQSMLDKREDRFTVAGIGFSMFERAWSLHGMENVLMDMLLYSEELDKLLDEICEYNERLIDIGLEYDIDAFYFGDDWGQQHGMIMGPDHWRRFIKPRMARMYRKVKDAGKYVIQHFCGDIHEIFPDLIDIGLDCYQSFQPEIYDVETIKRTVGNHLTFWGGISTQRLLPYASPDEVRRETIRLMKLLGQNGGYIAAPTHAVPGDVPPENILAMLDVFTHQDRYL